MSDSVRPHRRQPTRLPRPWDSPGKNTGVGCHFLLQCMKVESEKWNWSRSVMSNSQWPHGLHHTRLLHPWDFPGKSTGVGCHCLLLQVAGGVQPSASACYRNERQEDYRNSPTYKQVPFQECVPKSNSFKLAYILNQQNRLYSTIL